MNTEIETSRVDEALIHNADLYDQGSGYSNMVSADFARQLERELVELKELRDHDAEEVEIERDRLRDENGRLREALNFARKSEVEALNEYESLRNLLGRIQGKILPHLHGLAQEVDEALMNYPCVECGKFGMSMPGGLCPICGGE